MAKLGPAMFIIAGILLSITSKAIDSEGLKVFFWIGIFFILIGSAKLALKFVHSQTQKKREAKAQEHVQKFHEQKEIRSHQSHQTQQNHQTHQRIHSAQTQGYMNAQHNTPHHHQHHIKTCPKCNLQIYRNANFCPNCGTRFEENRGSSHYK